MVNYEFTPLVVMEWWVTDTNDTNSRIGHLKTETKVFDMTERTDYPNQKYTFVPFTNHLAVGGNADEFNFWYTWKTIRGRQSIMNKNDVLVKCKIDYNKIP